jgi:molecular chaperone GrpE (heat shock protein)
LLGTTGITSSDETTEDVIAKSIKNIGAAKASREAALTSGVGREKARLEEEAGITTEALREQSRGIGAASTFALIDKINQSKEKSIRDLDARYNEALTIGDLEIAKEISNLRLESIKTKEEAEDKAISRLMSFTNLSLNIEEARRSEEKSKLTNIYNAVNTAKSLDLSNMDSISKRSLETQLGVPTGLLDKVSAEDDIRVVDGYGLVSITKKNGVPIIKTLLPEKGKFTISEVKQEVNNIFSSQEEIDLNTYFSAMYKYTSYGYTQDDFLKDYPAVRYLTTEQITEAKEKGYNIEPIDSNQSIIVLPSSK